MTPQDLWLALTLVLIIEGLAYGLFPEQMKRMMRQVLDLPDRTLQNVGLAIAAFGAVLLLVF